ncbi:MAG: FAD:protein transferase [Mucilaginibacter sp.]|nr:FAD:protein transferase [Mucilaginibacter sp.]
MAYYSSCKLFIYKKAGALRRISLLLFLLLLHIRPMSLCANIVKAKPCFSMPLIQGFPVKESNIRSCNWPNCPSINGDVCINTLPKKYIFEEPKMGSPFTITICCIDSVAASKAANAAFIKADELNGILSDYLDNSEINRLSASSGKGKYMPVSAPLFDILERSLEAACLSGGNYDVSIGPLVKLWRQARKTKILPNGDSLRSARQKTNYKYIHLDTVNHAVWLEKAGMKLDIGGLGKGFVAAAVLEVLKKNGFFCAMVNAGGKIVIGQPPAEAAGWLIGINAPGEKEAILPHLLLLSEMAVATSGDIYQYVEFNGKRYSHIINPKTGKGLTIRRNVTAIAKDGTTADWLATACSVLPLAKSFQLIKKIPGAALLITENRNGKIYSKSSPNFKNYQCKSI